MTQANDILTELIEAAPEPAGLAENEVVHKGDEAVPMPIVVSSITSAGYAYIYDTKTGDRSMTNRNMLPAQLKKTRPDGSRVFTTIKPAIEPVTGHILCRLHANAPARAEYDKLGFPVCDKSNIISEFHLDRHMASKHKSEWAAIKSVIDKAERAEDRAVMRGILEGTQRGRK